MVKLRGQLLVHRDRLGQSSLLAALRQGSHAAFDVVNFAHLFSVSLLPLPTASMAVSRLSSQPVAFYAAVCIKPLPNINRCTRLKLLPLLLLPRPKSNSVGMKDRSGWS